MTDAEKKDRALRLLACADACDVATAASLIGDDFQFRFMERAASWSVDGNVVPAVLDRETFLKHGVTATRMMTSTGMNFTFELALCDGDFVCVFGESHALSNSGRPYNNSYSWRFRFKDDKIVEFLEYCDTHHAHEVLFG